MPRFYGNENNITSSVRPHFNLKLSRMNQIGRSNESM